MTSPPTRSADPKPSDNPISLLPEQAVSLGWLDALTRHRKIAYAFVVLLYVASFNGIWRVGVDSALYRGLARSIARDGTYFFAGEHHTHAFAGLPLILAALEKVFGDTPFPAMVLITLMALATLLLVDATLRLRYPLWVATIITIGMGVNYRYLRASQELMTDVPFMLGVMMTLYAYERLKLTVTGERIGRWAALLIGGLVLAAATRPTFGVLAIALVLGSMWAALTRTGGRRGIHLAIVGAAVVVTSLLLLLDPRTTLKAPFEGKYELELREAVKELPGTILGQLRQFLGANLNDAFFSQDMSPLAIPVALVLLAGCVLVWRRNAVWGLMVLGLVLVTLPLSTVPRYYIMVMPIFWLGWVILLSKLTLRAPHALKGAVMMIGVGLPIVLNLGRVLGVVVEQRKVDWVWLTRGGDRHEIFYSYYRDGSLRPLMAAARLLREHTGPADKIIGPSAHILAYFADRRVQGERSIFFERALSTYPSVLMKYEPDYVVMPVRLYEVTDPWMRDLLRRRILVPDRKIATTEVAGETVYLSTAMVIAPPENVKWTTYSGKAQTSATTRRITAEERAEILRKKARKLELEKRARKEKREKIERRERLERRERIERRERAERKEKREKIERRERREARERRERKAARSATMPTTAPKAVPTTTPTTMPVSAADFPLMTRPAWLDEIL